MRYPEQNAAEECKKRRVLDVGVDHSANDGPVQNLNAQRDDEKFFEQVPLELLLVKPQKLALNLSVLNLNNTYIDFLMKSTEKEGGIDKDGDGDIPGHGGIL